MNIAVDSSTLIALSTNCLMWLLGEFVKRGNKFYITPIVEYEVVNHPLEIRRFEFEALRIKRTINEGTVSVVSDPRIHEVTQNILELANRSYISRHGPLKLVHDGEAEVLALSQKLDRVLAIDEKTTRMIIEHPQKLRAVLEEKTGERVRVDGQFLRKLGEQLNDIHVLRSTELAAVGFERGMLSKFGEEKSTLNAVLWALRKAGCAISQEEIRELSA